MNHSQQVYKIVHIFPFKKIDLNEPEFTTDWREEVIKQVMEVFQKENELSMSELRNYVVGNLNDQSVDQISYLATKISNQVINIKNLNFIKPNSL